MYDNKKDKDDKSDRMNTPHTRLIWGPHKRPNMNICNNGLEKTAVLHNHICTALGTGLLECIVEPGQNHRSKLTFDVKVVYSGEVAALQAEIECHVIVEYGDYEWIARDWSHEVKIEPRGDANRNKFVKNDERVCIDIGWSLKL